jgi:hypothetical protein
MRHPIQSQLYGLPHGVLHVLNTFGKLILTAPHTPHRVTALGLEMTICIVYTMTLIGRSPTLAPQ